MKNKTAQNVILIQPPFVQLNSPYPAPYYLKSFLSKKGHSVSVLDHSIALFERIFSRRGLEQIFRDASNQRPLPINAKTLSPKTAERAEKIIERFFSEKELWLSSIDRLIAFLRGKDHEWGHFLSLANGNCPSGPRSDAFLAERGGEVSVDEAKILATKLLDDLADFITYTLDSAFSLVRYSPAIEGAEKTGFRDFALLKKSLKNSYIMNSFYRPMLNEEWEKFEKPALLGLTIPFPGCLVPALVCAESAKKHFGPALRTITGGGYVNTELRFLESRRTEFFDYFDYISLDRGYSFLLSVLEGTEAEKGLDDEAVKTVFPDYSGVDFDRYLYPVDDANPMHRLWSDGRWLKAYLAHGCYWHSCAFCDTTLDYIKNFSPVDPAALFAHLTGQAEKTGVRGVHFCDEATPPFSLLEFALFNRQAGLPLNFWGNIRFEKTFTPDMAAILAAGGLLGVSAGLEIVTENGMKRLGKGTDPESAVRACAAFKEAGVLTHAYLIYGYWDQDEAEIINSAEIVRQFFAQGLLDSAFWHKFSLTRHSRIYAEKQRGLHPALKITYDPKPAGVFALNDLSFEGEKKYEKYGEGLDWLLGVWMAGDTETPVTAAFPFKVKAPTVPPDYLEKFLDKYARERDQNRAAWPGEAAINTRVLFLGSLPRPFRTGKSAAAKQAAGLRWCWRLTERELKAGSAAAAGELAALLETASRGKGIVAADFCLALEKIAGKTGASALWGELRESGLVVC